MSDFPRAFGLFPIFGDFEYVDFTQSIEGAEITATEYGKNRIKVIELIPLPEHEAIVAAAVTAERERCAGIADSVYNETYCPTRSSRDCFDMARGDAAEEIARKIREVPS